MNPPAVPVRTDLSISDLREKAFEAYSSWVRLGLLLAVLGYLGVFATRFLVGGDPWDGAVSEGLAALGGLVTVFLGYRGRLRLAALLMVAIVWTEVSASILNSGTFRGSAAFVFPTLVLGSGLLLGVRSAWVMAVLSAVTSLVVPAVSLSLGMSQGLDLPGDFNAWAVLVAVLLGTAGLVHAGLRAFGSVLRDSEASRARYRDLVREAPDGILTVDGALQVQEVNPAAERLLGALVGELRGRAVDEVFPPPAGETLTRALREAAGENLRLTLRWIGAEEGPVILEASARQTGRGESESGFQIMLRDVTDREILQERAARLGRILEEARTEILIFRAGDGRLVQVSQGARTNLGYVSGELLGRPVSSICPNLALEGLEALNTHLESAGGRPVRQKGLHRRSDGGVYPVETEYLRTTLDGEPVVVAFAVDITDRNRAEEEQRALQRQLEHAQRMEAVGHLAGGVAHDFNNLLTVIGGCAEVLQEDAPQELWDVVQEIARAQEQGAVLTRQLLAFARREVAQPQLLSLPELVRGMRPLLARLAGPRIQLVLDPPTSGTILADPGQVEQVVMNLVANARDAMPDGGTITVSVRPEGELDPSKGGRWVLAVEDTGTGMDEATRARIFEPFFTTKPRGKGTGLGLATVHGIVTQNGGALQVETRLGTGSRFEILWPGAAPWEGDGEGERGEGEGQRGRDGVRILLAEDDESARRMVKRMLELDGHRVEAVDSGEEAQRVLESGEGDFDLLVSDVVMGGISGIELLERVRAAGVEIPALLVSGFLDERLHGQVPGDPSTALLHKPFRRAELRAHLARLLGQAPASEAGG